jgi:neutral ceramidase
MSDLQWLKPALLALMTALLLAGFAPVSQGADAPAFRAGFADRDITPAIGMEQPGGYGKAFHQKLHDPCKVRAAVFDDGQTRAALVSVDALLVRESLVQGARKRIQEQTGIAPEAVLIHATHSHSSGPTGMIYPGEYDHADEFVRTLAYEKSSNADLAYVKQVEDQIVAAVAAADGDKRATLANIGKGRAEGVAFNRRFFMKNGLTYTHPRPGNPEIVEAAGPVDPEVGVIGAWDAEGKLIGCVVNFVCHATTSPGGISANYICDVEQVLRGVFGENVVVVFLAGASGDVTQVDNLTPYANPKSEQWCRMVGGTIGAEAVKVLLQAEPGTLTPVAFASKHLPIPRRKPSAERVAKSLELCRKDPKEVGATEWTFAKEIVLLDSRLKTDPVADVEVQAVQVGPAVFLTDPAEFFCQFGLDIKAGSPFPFTFPVSLANGCVGYVPTEEAFSERGGGYETRLTSYSNLEITAGRKMVDAAIELSKALTPGTVPTRGPAAPYKSDAWGYGAVPPELD